MNKDKRFTIDEQLKIHEFKIHIKHMIAILNSNNFKREEDTRLSKIFTLNIVKEMINDNIEIPVEIKEEMIDYLNDYSAKFMLEHVNENTKSYNWVLTKEEIDKVIMAYLTCDIAKLKDAWMKGVYERVINDENWMDYAMLENICDNLPERLENVSYSLSIDEIENYCNEYTNNFFSNKNKVKRKRKLL